jgi:hypothetical protein
VPQLAPTAAEPAAAEAPSQWFATPREVAYQGDYDPGFEPPTFVPEEEHQGWYEEQPQQIPVPRPRAAEPGPEPDFPVPNGAGGTRPLGEGNPEGESAGPSEEDLYRVYRQGIQGEGVPSPGAFAADVEDSFGIRLQPRDVNRYAERFEARYSAELMEDHIA